MTSILKAKTISQHKLKRYRELEALVEEHKQLKEEILGLAESGLPCQPGRFSCSVKITSSTSVPWKTEYIRVTSEHHAELLLAENKGNSPRRSLVVTDRDEPLQ